MADLPWTERQYQTAMREAGYRSIGQGAYQHKETGYIFAGWTWKQVEDVNGKQVQVYSEIWRAWAAERQTPPPF